MKESCECYSMVRGDSVRHAILNGELEKSEASAVVSKNRSNQDPPISVVLIVIQKNDVLKLWDTQTGGIITAIQEGEMQAKARLLHAIVETNAGEDVAGKSIALEATTGNSSKALNP